MKLALTDFLSNRGGKPPVIVNEKAKREAAGLPPKKERVQVRAPQMKKLANAERVADEAIAKLEYLEGAMRSLLEMHGFNRSLEPNLWQDLDAAKAAVVRLRQELEAP